MKSLFSANKRGQVGALAPTIIIFVIAAFFLVMGMIVFQEIRDTDIVSQESTTTITNETLTTVSEVGESVTSNTVPCFNSMSVIHVQTQNGTQIPSSNYTATATSGLIQWTTGLTAVNNTNWNVSYTFLHGDTACESTNATLIGLSTFSDFWDIMVIAVILGIVMAIVIATFSGRSRR